MNVDNIREAVTAWLWHSGEETKYASRLYKHGEDVQAAHHAEAAAHCAVEAQRLTEMSKPGYVCSPTLQVRRLRRSVRTLEAYLVDAGKRVNHSEKLLRPHKPAPKR